MHAWYMQGLCRGQGDVLARISRHGPVFFSRPPADLKACRWRQLAALCQHIHKVQVKPVTRKQV